MSSVRITLLSLAAAATAVSYAQDTADTGAVEPVSGQIVLVDPLNEIDDGDFYCFDAYGDYSEEGDGMQVHTCKIRPRPPEDQTFNIDYPNLGNLNMALADTLCVEMERARAGASLYLLPCSTSARQRFVSGDEGQIHPASNTNLCLTVAHTRMCGNPDCSNYKRAVTLERCDSEPDPKFLTWTIPGGSLGL